MPGDEQEYLDQLPTVLQFLHQHFPSAAASLLNELKAQGGEPGPGEEDVGRTVPPAAELGNEGFSDDADEVESKVRSQLDEPGVTRCVWMAGFGLE